LLLPCFHALVLELLGQPIYPFGRPETLCEFTPAESQFAKAIGAFVRTLADTGSPGIGWDRYRPSKPSEAGERKKEREDMELLLTPTVPAGSAFHQVKSDSVERCAMWHDIWARRHTL
jgi:hypothetical protein